MNPQQDYKFFSSKKILAPMVRAGRTPLRTLALEYGADLVYTEEIVDQKLLNSRRIENATLKTVDFINGKEVVLRIAAEEKSRCVLQIGTNSAENAVQICRKFDSDVAAIDLNMGCPKPFSVHAGMGAALLSDPVRVKEILSSMISVSNVPISAKMRVLDSPENTMEFVRMVEQCGVSALAIHGRRRDEMPQHRCRMGEIHEVCHFLAGSNCPVIANGGSQEIRCYEDIERFREQTGASSVMVARKAFSNPSIFRPNGLLKMDEEICRFLAKACIYDENFTAVKYALQRILGSQQEFDPRGKATVLAGTVREICRIWGMEENFLESRRKRNSHQQLIAENGEEEENQAKRKKIDAQKGNDTFTLVDGVSICNLSFAPKRLKNGVNGKPTPKCELLRYCHEQRLTSPVYDSTKRQQDGRFTAVVSVNGSRFGSTVSQPNIKMAEQVAALVALHGLDIRHRLQGDWEDC